MKRNWTHLNHHKGIYALAIPLSFLSLSLVGTIHASTTTSTSAQLALQANSDLETAASSDYFGNFDATWSYTGGDLGATYTSTQTTFKVWAPTATSVKLLSYGKNTDPSAALVTSYDMTRGTNVSSTDLTQNTIGVWSYNVPQDENGMVYAYQLTFANGTVSDYPNSSYATQNTSSTTTTTQDPYSTAVVSGGLRSVVESASNLTPSGFSNAEGANATWRVSSTTQALIDEIHVRDFTNSQSSGVTASNLKGKFLGVSQTGTKDPNTGTATGLDYLKQAGFNYVQVMPMYDFASVSDTGNPTASQPDPYNWGYDPRNFNVPEGAYASDATNPTTRVLEAKQMIQGLHNNGLGVIMDVVYNHVSSQGDSPFEKTQPGYYFHKTTVTGCGNDLATNHGMYRQYILDSIKYWATNYDLDGFRFDIMANYDKDTLNMIRAELNSIDPKLLMYGEGWYMGADVPADQKVDISLAPNTPNIGYFNNGERDTVQSFVAGNTAGSGNILSAIRGSGDNLMNFGTVGQALNYVEIHDGKTISDLEWTYNINDSLATHNKRTALASAINILANGTTIMQAGQEFNRSRYVNVSGLYPAITDAQNAVNTSSDTTGAAAAQLELARNPYNGTITINGTQSYQGDVASNINWDLYKTNQSEADTLSQLMKFKAQNPSFWPNDYSQIYNGTLYQPLRYSGGIVSYVMYNGTNKYLVIINASGSAMTNMTNYYGYNLSGLKLVLSTDTSQTAGSTIGSSLTLSDLSATVIQIQ
ncbi:MAG: hypothetical protein LBI13_05185 [Streptococcaceae bacterium]|nr:hypothetical protein [Streptococcaceae bacterium]